MKTKFCFYLQPNYPHPRTAIEAEILFTARIKHLRFLKRPSGKTPRGQSRSGEKIGAESAVPILVYFYIVIIVHKYRQSAKESCSLKRNTMPEVFPLTIGSGKTRPFEKRHAGCEEREKINRRRIYDTLRINFFEATKQTACIFSKGDGNMTRKVSTTNLPGARGNAYPKAELDYDLTYEYDPAYAHRLIHAGNRYYRYDANGNITAEKDGPFTEDDEFIFTYSYDPDTDVYGTDYGFGLDAPKETEETHPENLFAYRRNYTWNEKNLLTKSSDRSYTVHYRYGEDGQRALKYTEEGRSETLYFNNFYTIHIPVQDKNNPQGLRVHKHIFVGNSRLVTAMTHTDNNGDNAEQREKRYYYHSDHLGSAQFVTDWRGKQYEHIEYTPYGELWIEEVAAGLDKLPFRFTGKEMDEETGLYYYGARYLDPKYSRWLSGDPALGEYIPKAPVDDEAKKHNEKLPGMGGVYNIVNMHLYHYAGNNPVKYTDPTGMWIDNGDGTYTAEKGDTLWDKYGADWKEKSGFTRDPRTLQVGETVGEKNIPTYSDASAEMKQQIPQGNAQDSNQNVVASKKSNDVAFSYGFGGKLALVLGLGAESGFIGDTSGNLYWYLSGSVGCGIQTPSTTKTDLSTLQYLKSAKGFSGGVSLDPTQVGKSPSLTADICLGVTGTYDLNNQKSSGLPNSWGFGSVGGGVWKTGTIVVPIYKKER
ncbi:RHS repeat domain-containing protein [Treponema sp. OMZ 803]|uniref:RHS repeat domain-containing protein n=1 Tax=Treponema sp. OMZ 803 TaxID=120682 RepID=UPI0020A27520|nr:RHS repeat-associated core domain-containing protein [Treponema sp. OMZ 803]